MTVLETLENLRTNRFSDIAVAAERLRKKAIADHYKYIDSLEKELKKLHGKEISDEVFVGFVKAIRSTDCHYSVCIFDQCAYVDEWCEDENSLPLIGQRYGFLSVLICELRDGVGMGELYVSRLLEMVGEAISLSLLGKRFELSVGDYIFNTMIEESKKVKDDENNKD